jgi:hypothetical protein
MLALSIFLLLAVGKVVGSGPNMEPVDPSQGLVLANSFVRFRFDPLGMGLSELTDLRSGFNHIQNVSGKHLLWEVAFAKGAQIERITNNYKPCNHAYRETLPDGSQRGVMEWNEVRWWREERVLTVRAMVELPKDSGVAHWRIFVQNSSDYWGLWTVSYPMIDGFPASGTYDVARPAQCRGGLLLKQCSEKIDSRYPSGDWPMQFMALSHGKNSVYVATMDPDARAKNFVIEPGEKLAIVHYVDNMGISGSGYPDYYPVALGVYQGTWIEAAQRYRTWALLQKWAQAGMISRRLDMPESIKNVALWIADGRLWQSQDEWVWNTGKGTPHELNEPLLKVQQELGVPIGIHWYNWQQAQYDNLYPHFLPARPNFRERVKELTDHGILVMPYINGMSADLNIPDFSHFAPAAILDESGGYRMHFYSDTTGRLLGMCPTQEVWQSAIATVVDDLVAGEKVNGVYIDQIASMPDELCFAKDHGHPVGGGSYWATGYRSLLRKVRDLSQRMGRRPVLTSEGNDEVFMDLVDANLTWSEPTEQEIPLYQLVYSGYTLLFGSPCDYKRSTQFFAYGEGEAFLDGKQPGWINLGLFKPEYADKVGYFRQIGKYRVATRKFLTFGRLLEPIDPINTVPTFTETGLGWYVQHTGQVPVAEGRLWQAEDGQLGVFLANYVDREIPFSYRIEPGAFGLQASRFRLSEITPDGEVPISEVSGSIHRTENLGPRKLKVIQIAPVAN